MSAQPMSARPASTRLPLPAALAEGRVVAIVRGGSGEHLLPVCLTLVEAGVRCLEVTANTPGWQEAVSELRSRCPGGVDVGAGTVLTTEQVAQTADAGGSFVVAPNLDVDVGRAAARSGLAWFPGALTPTEIAAAWSAGATAVKVFPASAVGGPEYLRQVRAPLDTIPLVPTGGVGPEQAGDYLRAGAVALGVGGPLIGDSLVSGDLAGLRSRAAALLAAVAEACA